MNVTQSNISTHAWAWLLHPNRTRRTQVRTQTLPPGLYCQDGQQLNSVKSALSQVEHGSTTMMDPPSLGSVSIVEHYNTVCVRVIATSYGEGSVGYKTYSCQTQPLSRSDHWIINDSTALIVPSLEVVTPQNLTAKLNRRKQDQGSFLCRHAAAV